MPDLLDHFFICLYRPDQHDQKERSEKEQGSQPVYVDAAYFFEIVDEFHNRCFCRLLLLSFLISHDRLSVIGLLFILFLAYLPL